MFINWLYAKSNTFAFGQNFWMKDAHSILLFLLSGFRLNKFKFKLHAVVFGLTEREKKLDTKLTLKSHCEFQRSINYSVSTCLRYFHIFKHWASFDVIFFLATWWNEQWNEKEQQTTTKIETFSWLTIDRPSILHHSQFVVIVFPHKKRKYTH